MATVVEVSGGYAFDTGKWDGVGGDAGAFHADPDDAEAEEVAGRNRGVGGGFEGLVMEQDRGCCSQGARLGGGAAGELTAGRGRLRVWCFWESISWTTTK